MLELLATSVFIGALVIFGFWYYQRRQREDRERPLEIAPVPISQETIPPGQIVIKTYTGSQDEATAAFQTDATSMAAQGYYPTAQSWSPGQYGAGAFIVALLLCFIIIGILVFIYMLIVKPPGTLTVTYERRAAVVEEKTCPRCAERIKAAALVCHFCGHEFPPSAPQTHAQAGARPAQ